MMWLAILILPAIFLALTACCACVVGSRADRSRYSELGLPEGFPARTDRFSGFPSLEASS